MPRLLNKKTDKIPADAVYIGRGSKWGNPFVIGKDGTRQEVIKKFRKFFVDSGLVNDVHELAGKDLVCFCAPLACHGDILLSEANPEFEWEPE